MPIHERDALLRELESQAVMYHDEEQRELRYMVEDIDQKGTGLSDWDVKFISGLIDRDIRTFTPKMMVQIKRLFDESLSHD